MKRQSGITVDVTRSTDAIDFEAWCASYVTACLDALRQAKQLPEAA